MSNFNPSVHHSGCSKEQKRKAHCKSAPYAKFQHKSGGHLMQQETQEGRKVLASTMKCNCWSFQKVKYLETVQVDHLKNNYEGSYWCQKHPVVLILLSLPAAIKRTMMKKMPQGQVNINPVKKANIDLFSLALCLSSCGTGF